MANSAHPPSSDAASLDRERLEFERRRLALEESWPRKWGSIFISAAATVAVGCITALTALYQVSTNKTINDQTDNHRKVDESRAALELYFKYVAEKPLDTPDRLGQLKSIAALTHDPQFLLQLKGDIELATNARKGTLSPSQVLKGSPDLKSPATPGTYRLSDFIYYVQYFAPKQTQSQGVTDTLVAMGLAVPGQQSMDERHSPNKNQIRFYRNNQKAIATQLGNQLKSRTGLAFQTIGPVDQSLPDGVMEIWIGRQ